MKHILLTLIVIVFAFSSCKKDKDAAVGTAVPVIESLTADKSEINTGGNDPAILTCVANGGGLEYLWEVDLGDIFPLNNEGSQVRFTGSPCCIGEKTLTCTVSNDRGSATKTIIIEILNPDDISHLTMSSHIL